VEHSLTGGLLVARDSIPWMRVVHGPTPLMMREAHVTRRVVHGPTPLMMREAHVTRRVVHVTRRVVHGPTPLMMRVVLESLVGSTLHGPSPPVGVWGLGFRV